MLIRPASTTDAAALLAIYRPYVEGTAVSFETQVPQVDEFAGRIERALAGWAWLVAEDDGECLGYAYGSAYRARAAYRWSVETSVYVRPERQRRGVGGRLYPALLAALSERGFCRALAGVSLPNPASIALHRRLGFEPVGVFTAVGRKFDRWHDVLWLQRALDGRPPGGEPRQSPAAV